MLQARLSVLLRADFEFFGKNSRISLQPIASTAHVPVPTAVLHCCSWGCAVVGIDPEAADAVDWDEIRSACLLSGRVEIAATGCLETAVQAELAHIERRLRSLGDGWGGT